MKILIKGYYGFGNLGDDVLMIVSYRILKNRFPEADFYIFANFNENLKGYSREKGYNNYIYNQLQEKVKLIDWTYKGHFDLVFNGGGGIYFDFRLGNRFFLLLNQTCYYLGAKGIFRIDRLVRRVFKKKRRLTFDKRIGFGLGIGPFDKTAPSFYEKVSEIGSYNTLIVRDESSFKFLHKIAFNGKKELASDIVFLKNMWCPPELFLRECVKLDKKFKIGIVLMDWNPVNRNFYSNIKLVAEELRKLNFEITFLSFDVNHDKNYLKNFGEVVISWQPDRHELKDFYSIIAMQDLIISARAHGAIIASCLGVPTICLGASQKLKDVSKMLPSSSQLIDPPFAPDLLKNSIFKVVSNYESYLKNVKIDVLMNETKVKKSLERLFS